MTESALIFDIEGDFAFFKTAEVTRATLSFPFTRTAIIGIIGSILGKDRNSYWGEDHPLGNAQIAVQLINSEDNQNFQNSSLTVNYAHTKYTVNIAARSNTLKSFISEGTKRGFVTDVRLDLLRNVHYRIYFRKPIDSKDQELYNELKKYLENNWSHYIPYLGHANLLADIKYIGEFPLNKISKELVSISSVIPVSFIQQDFLKILQRKISITMNIPIRMEINDGKIVNAITEHFMIPDKLKGEIQIKLKPDINSFSFQTDIENKIDSKSTNIVFIPNGKNKLKN